jgi:beta-lactamase class A
MIFLLGRAAAIAGLCLVVLAPAPPDARTLDDQVRAILAEHGDGVEAGLWVGGTKGDAWYAWRADEVRPTASAIKAAFLVELFARYAADLDHTPPGLGAILRDDHPAIAHFSAEGREEVRKGLSGASVRKIGGIMMGTAPASNLVYNAAANVATALLGGPEGLTKAIHARDSAFAPIVVRRYMLADRKARGDNEATAAALAAVLRRVASGDIPGLRPDVIDAIRGAILVEDYPGGGRHHYKTGEIDSDPLTRVRSGWIETPRRGVVVYTVMTKQPDPGSHPRPEAGERLAKTARRLADAILKDGTANGSR